MAQLSSVLCENPNVKAKEHLSLRLSERKISQWIRSTQDEQAQVGWGGGRVRESCQTKARNKCLALEVHPPTRSV